MVADRLLKAKKGRRITASAPDINQHIG